MGYLFNWCESLIEIPYIEEWDSSNIINMESLFAYCKSLKSLPGILKWNASKVKNM